MSALDVFVLINTGNLFVITVTPHFAVLLIMCEIKTEVYCLLKCDFFAVVNKSNYC